jgi:hypothetical protein
LSVRALYHWLVICLFSVVCKSRIRSEGVFLFGSFLSCFSISGDHLLSLPIACLSREFNQSLVNPKAQFANLESAAGTMIGHWSIHYGVQWMGYGTLVGSISNHSVVARKPTWPEEFLEALVTPI